MTASVPVDEVDVDACLGRLSSVSGERRRVRWARGADAAATAVAAAADDLQWIDPDRLSGPLGEAVRTTAVGSRSLPVPFGGGWAAVEVDAVQPAASTEGAERHRVRGDLLAARRGHALRQLDRGGAASKGPARGGVRASADPEQPDNTHRH